MRFWDTSAIVPLVLDQPRSAEARAILASDGGMVVWWGSVIECWSAAARLRRAGHITPEEESRVLDLLETLRATWTEVLPSEEVRKRARRLVRVHPVREADALQLASAGVWLSPSGAVGDFVSFDQRLREYARLEGMQPIGA